MHDKEENQIGGTLEGLRCLESFWHVTLPATFRNLYTHFPHPFVAPCEFFALNAICKGAGRTFGMLPQLLPFGRAVGEGGVYGFYATPETTQGDLPVLYWEEEENYLRPVAANFDAFLRHCVLIGRYETEEQWPDDVTDWQEEEERSKLAECLGLPRELLFGRVPRNDAELYERLVQSDPQDAVSLCHLGCIQRARGNWERALDFYHRACEAAPWFGDSAYLVADIYREQERMERATQYWQLVVQRPLPLCTRTYAWDLGEDHPEADIYEVAADGLSQFAAFVEPDFTAQPLWIAITEEDPYDPEVREELALLLLSEGDLEGAEREMVNALSLCTTERGAQPLRLYESLIALYERLGRKRDVALARHDYRLPRNYL